jgi:hypothetical protein
VSAAQARVRTPATALRLCRELHSGFRRRTRPATGGSTGNGGGRTRSGWDCGLRAGRKASRQTLPSRTLGPSQGSIASPRSLVRVTVQPVQVASRQQSRGGSSPVARAAAAGIGGGDGVAADSRARRGLAATTLRCVHVLAHCCALRSPRRRVQDAVSHHWLARVRPGGLGTSRVSRLHRPPPFRAGRTRLESERRPAAALLPGARATTFAVPRS